MDPRRPSQAPAAAAEPGHEDTEALPSDEELSAAIDSLSLDVAPPEPEGAWPSGPSSSPRVPSSELVTPRDRLAPQPPRGSASEWDTLPPSGVPAIVVPKPSKKLREEAARRRQSPIEPERPQLPLLRGLAAWMNKLPPVARLTLVLLPLALGLLLFAVTFWAPPGSYYVQPELTRMRRRASPSARIIGKLARGQRVRRVLLRGPYALVLVEPAGPAGFVKAAHLDRQPPQLDPSLPSFEGCAGPKDPAACAALAETQRASCEQSCAAEPSCARRCSRAAQRCMARCAP